MMLIQAANIQQCCAVSENCDANVVYVICKAAFTRQTKLGRLKLACAKDTKTVGKHVGKALVTNS